MVDKANGCNSPCFSPAMLQCHDNLFSVVACHLPHLAIVECIVDMRGGPASDGQQRYSRMDPLPHVNH